MINKIHYLKCVNVVELCRLYMLVVYRNGLHQKYIIKYRTIYVLTIGKICSVSYVRQATK